MRTIWGILAVLAVLAACSSNSEPTGDKAGDKAKPEPPLRVELGDCALPTATFVSGPRPMPFEFDQSDVKLAAAAAAVPSLQTTGGAFASLTGTGDIASGFDDSNIYGGLLGNEAGEMTGGFGFGRSGFGPGGGTGWGTIGTGAYGTIGRGGMRGRRAAVPTVSLGQANVQGDLDKAIIRRYLKRNIQKIQYCYEKELLAHPKLAGTVGAEFTITPQGRVNAAKVTGISPQVSSCIQQVIEAIEFPKPKGGGSVAVSYPFVFRPAARGATSAPDPAATSAPDPAAPASGSAAPASGSAADSATAAAAAKPVEAPYAPSARNPLRGQAAALAACLRKQPRPYGVFVVDLSYETSGTKAAVHGLDDNAARACVVEIASKLAKQQVPAHRCSVAFGELPIADAPAVEITAEELRWLGKRIAALATLAADDKPPSPITALMEPAVAYAKETAAAAASTPVALRGPVLLRTIDATPMKIVNRVINTMAAADVDLVLARRGPSDWKLLRRVGALPIVPVPLGTGGSWNLRRNGRGSVEIEERVALSIHVTADKILVGISRINDFVEIPAAPSGHDLARLERILVERKRNAFFADRDDLEVGAEDAVRYGDVASILELADKVGFSAARLMEPAALSVRSQP